MKVWPDDYPPSQTWNEIEERIYECALAELTWHAEGELGPTKYEELYAQNQAKRISESVMSGLDGGEEE